MDSVEITAGSRLHFGLLCARPGSRWHYGGVGLMIDTPQWRLDCSLTGLDTDIVRASADVRQRLTSIIREFRSECHAITGVRVTVKNEVPIHSGLGSGTQLTLAAGMALMLLSGRPRPSSVSDLATALGRSRRSAVGTHGFDQGGFIIDYGRDSTPVHSAQRIAFPDNWRMVLLTPRTDEGLSGDTEESFFGKQRYLEATVVKRLEGIIEDRLTPAVVGNDFTAFAQSLAEYGHLAGDYYSQAQGGIFSSPLMRSVVTRLEQQGTVGAVQSSWGPTICYPAASDNDARQLVSQIEQCPEFNDLSVTVAKGLNTGALIKTTAPENQRSFG